MIRMHKKLAFYWKNYRGYRYTRGLLQPKNEGLNTRHKSNSVHNISALRCPQTPASPDGTLEAYWIYVNKTCYWASGSTWKDLVSWFDGQTLCHQLGGNLATIHGQYEMNTLLGLFQRLADRGWWNYWIGLSEMTSKSGEYELVSFSL